MAKRGWRHFSHEADLGISGWGPTLEAAFEEAALALTAAVTTAEIVPATRIEITCRAADAELLLAAWLDAIIYEMAVRRMIFGRFEVHIADNILNAAIWGERIDRARHEPACEPKGATYTALKVSREESGRWSVQCVVDV